MTPEQMLILMEQVAIIIGLLKAVFWLALTWMTFVIATFVLWFRYGGFKITR